MGCGRSVKYNPDKLEMLIEQLKQEYSDEEKKEYLETLKRIVNSRKKIEEKLILVFNCVYFGDAYIIQNEFSNAENINDKNNKIIIKKLFKKNFSFGNHRKYMKKDYEEYKKAFEYFSEHVLDNMVGMIRSSAPFDEMYNLLREIPWFGRTAAWDFLEIIDRNIAEGRLNPPHMYISDSTGPKRGVKYFFEIKDNPEIKGVKELEKRVMPPKYIYKYFNEAGNLIKEKILKTNIDKKIKSDKFLVYKLEDALCNFQKGKQI